MDEGGFDEVAGECSGEQQPTSDPFARALEQAQGERRRSGAGCVDGCRGPVADQEEMQ